MCNDIKCLSMFERSISKLSAAFLESDTAFSFVHWDRDVAFNLVRGICDDTECPPMFSLRTENQECTRVFFFNVVMLS